MSLGRRCSARRNAWIAGSTPGHDGGALDGRVDPRVEEPGGGHDGGEVDGRVESPGRRVRGAGMTESASRVAAMSL